MHFGRTTGVPRRSLWNCSSGSLRDAPPSTRSSRSFKPESFSYGLSDYLADKKVAWKDCIAGGFEAGQNLHICFSGKLPPNPSQLLTGNRFAHFLQEAGQTYDKVILDTAPCMSVADTLVISRLSDITLYLIRAGISDKSHVKYAGELAQKKQLPNMAYILNDVGSLKSRQYN